MRPTKFFFYLFSIVAFLTLILIPLHNSPRFSPYVDLSVISISILSVYNIIIFMLSSRYQKQSKEKQYISLIYLNFLIKLVLILAIPILYYLVKSGISKNFVIPFIIIYIFFTIFETYVLNKNIRMRR